ncbi:N,N-dimethylformamidase beta subunit family domain-containing protein [Chryseosolibacter indicus]|uniref:N,N-dimethylformamidase beta subunit-like C-terminal domain-containing protein n=1 Tax=Chryseosolibacter indicus TaxID=2782351 RepID=A0ABS5VZD7_9BACT|nr:N,N-dimethylformamidase beta subunit family domain-containing protein [Chryseosolibacter indicus]MBT1706220.1 hypothetical protein [Chryseosolibacter indicus]
MMLLTFLLNLFFFVQQPYTEIIDGYTDKLSAFPGDSIELYLNATAINKHDVKLYDLAGKEVSKVNVKVFPQSPSVENAFENGLAYKKTCKVMVPNLISGVYMWANKIPFIIKTRNPKIVVVYSSNTVNAYCNSGGKSLYSFNSSDQKAAPKVSFLRPMPLPSPSEAFLRWLPQQPYKDVGYITDMDLDDYEAIKKSELIIIPGHSEYWTLQARKNFDRFVREGKNAMILSGNTMWWQVRYNEKKDRLICYRNAEADPVKSPKLKTINWCDPSLKYSILSSTGTDFQNAGYGRKIDKGWDGFKIVKNSPLLEGTNLTTGDILRCPSDELDGAPLLKIENDVPLLDYQQLGFKQVEIVGYDFVWRGGKDGVATWIVFKATESSGTVINTASTDWCSYRGIGSNADIKKITDTMIRKLINNENVFSTNILNPVN